jgi:hypothetical protein
MMAIRALIMRELAGFQDTEDWYTALNEKLKLSGGSVSDLILSLHVWGDESVTKCFIIRGVL